MWMSNMTHVTNCILLLIARDEVVTIVCLPFAMQIKSIWAPHPITSWNATIASVSNFHHFLGWENLTSHSCILVFTLNWNKICFKWNHFIGILVQWYKFTTKMILRKFVTERIMGSRKQESLEDIRNLQLKWEYGLKPNLHLPHSFYTQIFKLVRVPCTLKCCGCPLGRNSFTIIHNC